MKLIKIFSILISLSISLLALADDPIPANAKLVRQLNCQSQFVNGGYEGVHKVVFKDVTYMEPHGAFYEFASTVQMYSPTLSMVTGRLDQSNGLDPEDVRDAAPTETLGGVGWYILDKIPTNQYLVLVTRSTINQQGFKERKYDAEIDIFDQSGFQAEQSFGQLHCTVQ